LNRAFFGAETFDAVLCVFQQRNKIVGFGSRFVAEIVKNFVAKIQQGKIDWFLTVLIILLQSYFCKNL